MAETRGITDVQTRPDKARRDALRQLAEAALRVGAGFSLDAREVLDLLAVADQLAGGLSERASMVRGLQELQRTVTDLRARLVLELHRDGGGVVDSRGLLGTLDGLRGSLSGMERDVRETPPSALVLGADGKLVGVVEDRVDDPRRDELLRAADAVLRARKDGTLDGSQWIDRLYQAWSNGGGPERAAMDSGAILGKRVRPCPPGPQGQRCTKAPGHDGWHEAPCGAPHHANADDLDEALRGQESARRERDAALKEFRDERERHEMTCFLLQRERSSVIDAYAARDAAQNELATEKEAHEISARDATALRLALHDVKAALPAIHRDVHDAMAVSRGLVRLGAKVWAALGDPNRALEALEQNSLEQDAGT